MSSRELAITKNELVEQISILIQNNKGDLGRLNFIKNCIQKNKTLYNSDKLYLAEKIGTTISIEEEIPLKNSELVTAIKNIIECGIGDSGRLHYILNCIQKNKSLYSSDQKYIDEKIAIFKKRFSEKIIKKQSITRKIEVPIKPVIQQKQTFYDQDVVEKLKLELDKSKTTIRQLEKIIQVQKIEIQNLKNELIKITNVPTNAILNELNEKIRDQKDILSKQKLIEKSIKIQKESLTQLIGYREEYEHKINHEKELLEKQLKLEKQKVKEQDDMVKLLAQKQDMINSLKAQRDVVLEQIKLEKNKIEPELNNLRLSLENAQKEYDQMMKNYQNEKNELNSKINDQNEKNTNANKSNKNKEK